MNDLIAANERLTQELARQRATEAALRVPDAIVTGDRIQLQQVVLNLLRNAADAMVDVHDRPRQLLIRTAQEHGDWVRAPSSSDTRDVSGRSPTMPRRHVLVLHSTRASRSRLASTLIKTN
ncbi:MAG TPA: hypothetical protein VH436_23935 [Vicinamibacterales bacterium]